MARALGDRIENGLLVLPGVALLAAAFVLPIAQMLLRSISGADGLTLSHFWRFLSDPFYLGVLWRTVKLSAIITVLTTLIGFPYAYMAARVSPRARLWLILLVILPLMTSVVVRTFGWVVLLGRNGLISDMVRALGIGGRNFQLMQTEIAIVLGLTQVLLPFMVLSVLGVILSIDPRLEEAARTMGAGFLKTIRTVVVPLSMPGIVAGSLLVFTLSASSFVTPNLLGGVRLQVLAGSIYRSITQTLDWPFAAAQAVILFMGVLVILTQYARLSENRRG